MGSFVKSQSYDSYSRALVTTYPAGTSSFAVKSVYNAYGYVSELRNNASNALLKRIDTMTSRGQIESQTLGNGVTTFRTYEADTGYLSSTNTYKGGLLNSIAVTYDGLGNVKTRRSDYAASGLSHVGYTENYQYDTLNRLENRSLSIFAGSATLPNEFKTTQTYTLDDWGNFKFKTGAGHYRYDANKVHKLLGVYSDAAFTSAIYNFGYDANGNITSDGSRTFTYGSFDKPTLITKSGVSSAMRYGVSRELYYKEDSYIENGKNVTYQTSYLGGYEKIVRIGGNGPLTEHKYYVGDIVVTQRSNASTDTYYLHKDHQGSVVATTNKYGNVISQAIYDPFGKRSSVYLESSMTGFIYSEPTDRGYTGHKHIKQLDIIHMGGRIYDPTLGRFLQADPFIQAPSDSQSYNRYAYVRNNPMSMTDPSGYSWWSKTWKKIRPYVGIIVAIIGTYLCGSKCGQLGYALVGAASGAAGAAANGGNIFTGALRGALSAAVFYGVGTEFTGGDFGSYAYYSKVAAHAITGGIMSVLQGGKFGHGFAAAGMTQGFAKSINGISSARFSIGRIMAAAVVGGTVSKITGGKFANGAKTGAFSRMFNDEVHWNSKKRLAEQRAELMQKVRTRDRFFKNNANELGSSYGEYGHGAYIYERKGVYGQGRVMALGRYGHLGDSNSGVHGGNGLGVSEYAVEAIYAKGYSNAYYEYAPNIKAFDFAAAQQNLTLHYITKSNDVYTFDGNDGYVKNAHLKTGE